MDGDFFGEWNYLKGRQIAHHSLYGLGVAPTCGVGKDFSVGHITGHDLYLTIGKQVSNSLDLGLKLFAPLKHVDEDVRVKVNALAA